MGLLKDDVLKASKDLECIQKDIRELNESMKKCECGKKVLGNLQKHIDELDIHLKNVFAHVINNRNNDEKQSVEYNV